jgi:PadR family transcriptional regulator PadR
VSIRSWWKRKTAESPLVRISHALLDNPGGRHFGYPLSRASGVRSYQMYRIVGWMLEQGWLTHGWESAAEADGRPPRRWYRLTDTGLVRLTAILEQAGDAM